MFDVLSVLGEISEIMEHEQQDRKSMIKSKMKIKVSDPEMVDGEAIDRLIYNHSVKRSDLQKLFGVSATTLKKWIDDAVENRLIESSFTHGVTHYYNRFTVAKLMDEWKHKRFSDNNNPIVIVFQNHKGGTGKSTSAISIATACALDLNLNARVLIADLDPQGTAGQNLIHSESEDSVYLTTIDAALSSYESDRDFSCLLRSGYAFDDIVLSIPFTTHLPNLDVLPAFTDDERFVDFFWSQDDDVRLDILKVFSEKIMPVLKKRYDIIIVDTPPQNSPILWAINESSDAIVIPVTTHEYDFASTANYMKALRSSFSDILPSQGANVKWLKFLPVNYNNKSVEDNKVLDKIIRSSAGNLLTSPIAHSEAFLAASASHRTVLDFKKSECLCSSRQLDVAVRSVESAYLQFISEMKRISKK